MFFFVFVFLFDVVGFTFDFHPTDGPTGLFRRPPLLYFYFVSRSVCFSLISRMIQDDKIFVIRTDSWDRGTKKLNETSL